MASFGKAPTRNTAFKQAYKAALRASQVKREKEKGKQTWKR